MMPALPSLQPEQLGRTLATLHATPSTVVTRVALPLAARTALSTDAAVVVVKRTRITSAESLQTFRREADLLRACAGHPHVVQPLALCVAPPVCALVLPSAEHGSLFDALHVAPHAATDAPRPE